jgi:hypothetical protein
MITPDDRAADIFINSKCLDCTAGGCGSVSISVSAAVSPAVSATVSPAVSAVPVTVPVTVPATVPATVPVFGASCDRVSQTRHFYIKREKKLVVLYNQTFDIWLIF